MKFQVTKSFTMENNIIIGKTINYEITFKNAGQAIIEIMQKNPEHIGQVIDFHQVCIVHF